MNPWFLIEYERVSLADSFIPAHIASSYLISTFQELAFIIVLSWLHAETKIDNLCIAGGCALNRVTKGKIFYKTPFRDVFIQNLLLRSEVAWQWVLAVYSYRHKAQTIIEMIKNFGREDYFVSRS